MSTKRIPPEVVLALKEALSVAFWFKKDLRSFVSSCLRDDDTVARIDWEGQVKRASVDQLVTHLDRNQHNTFDDLLSLVLATSEIDPQPLRRLDDGERLYQEAGPPLRRLKEMAQPLRAWREEREQAAIRREQERKRSESRRAVVEQLSILRADLMKLTSMPAQSRGYALEKFLTRLFETFDIEAKGSFRLEGEQIDGAFTFENAEYILEAKWKAEPTERADLDVFAQKIHRKLDNTLGLFVAVNGFQGSGVAAHSGARPTMVLMDGQDLMAVLDERIDLPDLLRRKRQHASRTGEVFVSLGELLA